MIVLPKIKYKENLGNNALNSLVRGSFYPLLRQGALDAGEISYGDSRDFEALYQFTSSRFEGFVSFSSFRVESLGFSINFGELLIFAFFFME